MTENQATEMKNFVVRIPVQLESRIKMQSHTESLKRNTHLKPTDLVREILTRELCLETNERRGE